MSSPGIIVSVRAWLVWFGDAALRAAQWIAPSRRAALYWAAILALAAIMLLIRQDQYRGCVRASTSRWEQSVVARAQATQARALATALPIVADQLNTGADRLDASASRLELITAPTVKGRETYCNDVVPRWLIHT